MGHASQVPNKGDYYTTTVGNEPVVMVRHTDGSVKVLYNRCAHKGTKLASEVNGKCRPVLPLPVPRLDVPARRQPAHRAAEEGLRKHRLRELRGAQGPGADDRGEHLSRLRVLRGSTREGAGFEEYFGESLSSIDNMVDRSPARRLEVAGGVLRYMHDCNWKMFVENLNDAMHPMVAHESSAGTAKRLWESTASGDAQPMVIEQFAPFVNGYEFFEKMGVKVYDNGHSYTGVNFSIHATYSSVGPLRAGDGRGVWRGAREADPGRGSPQHGLLPEPHHQGADPGHSRGAPARGGQDADRELDLSPRRRAG